MAIYNYQWGNHYVYDMMSTMFNEEFIVLITSKMNEISEKIDELYNCKSHE